MDSIERRIRKNAFDVSGLFSSDNELATVHTRADALLNHNRMIGFA